MSIAADARRFDHGGPSNGENSKGKTMNTICENTWKKLLAPMTAAVVVIGCSGPAEPPPAAVQTRQTLNKKTQNVLELSDALGQGGVRAEMSIKSQGLGVAADAYRTSVGKLSVIAVEQKMALFQAENDRKPQDYAEFMARIIEPGKPDGLMLPMLPYYQEYAYDPDAKELVVVEFPAKKEQRQKETTGASGL